ncbi:GH92 family glycosyl hydrolase [Frigoriflavimonas asaccharolytica]
MKYISTTLLIIISIFSNAQNFAKHVNPFIGTGGHGHTFPGATVPHGMVQLSPDTRIDGSWDGCSGYHYSDNVIYGFSHTHLNGTGVSDFGDIMLMPTMGEPSFDNKVYSSKFSHENEKASAGFYSVKLDDDDIDVRLTTSTRVGFHEYTFNKAGNANIILDLNHRDELLEGEVRIIDNKTVEILRRSKSWAQNQYVYARIEFSKPMPESTGYEESIPQIGTMHTGYKGFNIKVAFSNKVKKGEKILVKVSLSPTSFEGAKLNSTEIKHWDFEKVKADAENLWNKELSKIEVKDKDQDKMAIFYTALYHTMIQPNIAQDLDGKYRGMDNKIHRAEGFNYYSVFSLWDTFRAAHPLYTLIDKKRTADYINTFLKMYEQGGRLPVWELASNETDCMIGYHSVSVIADAMAKGITGFDYEKAFEASKSSAMLDVLGLKAYKENGFISIDDDHESVSKTLEYAYDDWCIAQMAQILNKNSDYEYFMKRSQNWKNLFNYKTGFIQPKKNGGWEKPFDPREVNNNYTEGNAWQYTFFVPQDISGMIETFGGNAKFEQKLDEMFNSESKTTGREQVDVTGLIGQYAHGNEPSHHMAYLYNYIGKPNKTKKKVHYILENFYKNSPDGLIGNEDCGQMSAWYVLSSMGIYQVTPGLDKWESVEPYFKNGKINFGEGKLENIAESIAKVNNFDKNFGGLKIYPVIIPVPTIEAESKSFKNNLKIDLFSESPHDEIYFLESIKGFDYSTKKRTFVKYKEAFFINETSTIQAYVKNKNGQSNTISGTFYKKPNNYSINIHSKYNSQYTAGGDEGLIDGIYGDENWKKGEWQGYQSQDFEAVIDLKKEKEISEISANFLQDSRSWILMPSKVEFYASRNDKEYFLIETINNEVDAKNYDISIKKIVAKLLPTTTRFIKVKAYNFGKLPDWHQGVGGDAFIFIDEIEVR